MSSQSIEVVVPPAINVDVEVNATSIEVSTSAAPIVLVENAVSRQNLWVSNTQPAFSGPGIWVQTGLGADGAGFTFWIEDGQ